MYVVDKTQQMGKGIKKTYGYKSKVNQEEILKKREEFWGTRVEGNQESWNALKLACNGEDLESAIEIMRAIGIKLIK